MDIPRINEELKEFEMMASIQIDHDRNVEEQLIIQGKQSGRAGPRIAIHHRDLCMIRENLFFHWTKYENGIEINQYDLLEENFVATGKTEFIDITLLEPGIHHRTTILNYHYFVTFFRKTNLERKENFHEQYVIIILHENKINIIPLEQFNESGGDPLYVWPAVASLETTTGKLHGYGMRMGSFSIDISMHINM